MSFLKFWGKKDKKDSSDSRREDSDPEAEKRRLRHQLSISRSGRFKQKKRERCQILDKPELFNGQGVASRQQDDISQSSASSTTSSAPAHPLSTNTTCRDVNTKMAPGSLQTGPSVVT